MYKTINEKFMQLLLDLGVENPYKYDIKTVGQKEFQDLRINLLTQQKINYEHYRLFGEIRMSIKQFQKHISIPDLFKIRDTLDTINYTLSNEQSYDDQNFINEKQEGQETHSSNIGSDNNEISFEDKKDQSAVDHSNSNDDNIHDVIITQSTSSKNFVDNDSDVPTSKNNISLNNQVTNSSPAMKSTVNESKTLRNEDNISSDSFLDNIQNLSITSKEAIVNAEKLNSFTEYIHIKRSIEDDLLEECKKLNEKDSGLILLIGSVGDGKSHLLAYLKNSNPNVFRDLYIHNDATESHSPSMTASETLENVLNSVYHHNQKTVIAINIGMLHNFYTSLKRENKFTQFTDFIDESLTLNVAENKITEKYEIPNNETHSIVSFLNHNNIHVVDGVIQKDFYSSLIERIFIQTEDNPLYSSFIKEDGFNREESIYVNYRLLLNKKVQDSIMHLLNVIRIQNKRILTARSVLNFIHDIIVSDGAMEDSLSENITTLLFENEDKSNILESISLHDPKNMMTQEFEEYNMRIYNTESLIDFCRELLGVDYDRDINSIILKLSNLGKNSHHRIFATIMRLYFLFNFEKFVPVEFNNYLKILSEKEEETTKLIKNVQNALYKWNGSPQTNYLYKKPWNSKDNIRVAIYFDCQFNNIQIDNNVIRLSFQNAMDSSTKTNPFVLEIDYSLYSFIEKISNGYVIKNINRSNYITFNEYIENIIDHTKSLNQTIVTINSNKRHYLLSKDIFKPEIKEIVK